jgi:hypothetical protein
MEATMARCPRCQTSYDPMEQEATCPHQQIKLSDYVLGFQDGMANDRVSERQAVDKIQYERGFKVGRGPG